MNTCVMCGEYTPEGTQVCWTCSKACGDCEVEDKKVCLICDYWRNQKYRTETDDNDK